MGHFREEFIDWCAAASQIYLTKYHPTLQINEKFSLRIRELDFKFVGKNGYDCGRHLEWCGAIVGQHLEWCGAVWVKH